MTILLLNYAHPLTPTQREQVAALLGETLEVRELATQADRHPPSPRLPASSPTRRV